ncbi:MAG: acyl-CoA dehydratase activase [Planctomycetota bacterium]|jgi:predicted CoA-substrate-specific enzyme activase
MAMEPLFLGVDVGSTATKALLIDDTCAVRAQALAPSGTDFFEAARETVDRAVAKAGSANVRRTVATGYGRKNLPFAHEAVTEITCHARGALHHLSPPFLLVDIGGQDNKVIRLDESGRVADFSMNRKCAAGTGAFIEEIARRLGLEVSEIEPKAREAAGEAAIGSFCTVFASTEILKLIQVGTPVPDIAKGALRSVIKRVMEMASFTGKVALSGGVAAHHPLIVEMLAQETGAEVSALPEPQFIGALGAALIAREKSNGDRER